MPGPALPPPTGPSRPTRPVSVSGYPTTVPDGAVLGGPEVAGEALTRLPAAASASTDSTPAGGQGRRGLPVPAPLLVLTAIVSVQLGSATARTIFDRVGPAGAVLLRLAFGALVMLLVVRPSPRRLDRAAWTAVGCYGLVLCAMNLSFYEAIRRIPLGPAVTLEFIGPMAVALAGSRRPRDLVWVALAAAGVAALTEGGHGGVTLVGAVFALVAGACWAAYILISKWVGQLVPGTAALAWALLIGALLVLPLGLASGGTNLLEPLVLVVGLGVGLLSSVIPYSCELTALRHMPTRVFGVLMSLEPAMAALAGLLVLGQTLAPRQVLGVLSVSVASAGVTLVERHDRAAVRA